MAHDVTLRPAHSERGEVLHLIERIQALTVEVQELHRRGEDGPELQAKEQTREHLRCRLARVAREAASNTLGTAA